MGKNGATLPVIEGAFDKNNNSDNFIQLVDSSKGVFTGTLSNVSNALCVDVQHGSIISLKGANITKHASATASSAAASASYSSTISAQGATVPYATIDGGSFISLDGGTATGGTSETVNTLTARS